MIQAHQGYLQTEVQLIADNNLVVKIPKNRRITILWEEINETKDNNDNSKEERIKDRLTMVESLKGILPKDVDLKSAREERISKRGLMDV